MSRIAGLGAASTNHHRGSMASAALDLPRPTARTSAKPSGLAWNPE
jgi:hypothetical protein